MTDLFVTQLVEAISDIRSRRTTGALRLTVGAGMRMAFFEDGSLVYYASDNPEDGLGPALARPGRLDSEEGRRQVEELESQVSRKQPLLALLLEGGLVDRDKLATWLTEHFYEAFARMFDSPEGSAKLMMGIKADHPLAVSVRPSVLILEAVRRMKDETIIREALGPLDHTTEPASDHSARIQSLPLQFYDGLVASQVTHKVSLEELIMVTGLPESDAAKALLALRLSGVLEPFEPPKKQTDTGRLRMRQAALDSGIPLDAESAAVAFAMGTRRDPVPVDGALSMGEFTGQAQYEAPAPPVVSDPEPPVAPGQPTRQRGDTAKLKLLSSAYKQMADAEVASGNVAGAIQYYESALKQSPDNLELLLGISKLLVDRPNGQKSAEKFLDRACTAHPREVKPRIELAKLYKATGRASQAEELLRAARRIDPDDPVVNAMLQRKEEKGGGFFSRLRGSSGTVPEEAKPKPEPYANAPRTTINTSAETSESGSLISKRCRHCGNMCRPNAAACNRCGATL